MPEKIGKYPVKQYLGSLDFRPDTARMALGGMILGPLGGGGGGQVLRLGVRAIASLSKMLRADPAFDVSPEIKADLANQIEFYKVTLVIDFDPKNGPPNSVFVSGKLTVKLISSQNAQKSPEIYSIYPMQVDQKTQVTRTVGVDGSLKLAEVGFGGSYKAEMKYDKVTALVVGHFAAGPNVSWEFAIAPPAIKQIRGVQMVEFTVKQPSNTSSIWSALPEGTINWGTSSRRLIGRLFRERPAQPKNSFAEFGVP